MTVSALSMCSIRQQYAFSRALGSDTQCRDFVKLSSAAAAWPGTVFGQQPNQVGRIGVLMEGIVAEPDYLAAFVQGRRQLGWIERSTVDVR
jgi:hypothetical protein